MMSRDASGQRIKIISTFDASYSHASLSKRVASGDISVVRLQDNEVELKIAEVKALDAGLYWCQTPSTDSVISGNYEAQVQLTGKRGMYTCLCFKPVLEDIHVQKKLQGIALHYVKENLSKD